jgi:hypothetical protein
MHKALCSNLSRREGGGEGEEEEEAVHRGNWPVLNEVRL